MSRSRIKKRSRVPFVLGSGLCAGLVLSALAASSYIHWIRLSPVAQAALSEPAIIAPQPQKEKYILTANDAGKTYTFTLGSRFSVLLDDAYPKALLRCTPRGIIEEGDAPVATKPLWAARFYAAGLGSCTLSDEDFTLTIIVDAGE